MTCSAIISRTVTTEKFSETDANIVQQPCVILPQKIKNEDVTFGSLFSDNGSSIVQNMMPGTESIDKDDDSVSADQVRAIFATVEALDTHLATRSYVTGYSLSEDDEAALASLKSSPSSSAQPHAYRWALHISALTGKRLVCCNCG
jgi:hypothetical protein